MAVQSFTAFQSGNPYPPNNERQRIAEIAANRRLFNNETRDLTQLQRRDNTTDEFNLRLNLFRRAVDIYVNFLLSGGIRIEYADEAGNDLINPLLPHLLSVLYAVNTDSRRYGVGVVTLDQQSGLFTSYEPDQWTTVTSNGILVGDVFADFFEPQVEVTKQQSSDINQYNRVRFTINDYTDNKQRIREHVVAGGTIGEQVGDIVEIDIIGRQAAPLFHGYSRGQLGTSVFDDIRDIVGDMIRIKERLSFSISQNARPHLCLPSGVIDESGGTVQVNPKGMMIPLNQGDPTPFYLQWDTNADASKFQIDEHWQTYFNLTAIPPILFNDSQSAPTSGEALKRLMIPFISNLAKTRRDNIVLLQSLLIMLANRQIATGTPQLPAEEPDIDLPYEDIFLDMTNQESNQATIGQEEAGDERTPNIL